MGRYSSSAGVRALDRVIGLLFTIAGGIALVSFHRWLINRHQDGTQGQSKDQGSQKKKSAAGESYGGSEKSSSGKKSEGGLQFDDSEPLVEHLGSCHCEKTRFRIMAPRRLKVIDKSSKIRYPRVSVAADNFELLSDERFISMYPVQCDKVVSVHTFCSYCGVNILYSPTISPVFVEINVDCLDRSNIDQITCDFAGVCNAVSCSAVLESLGASRLLSAQGTDNDSKTNEVAGADITIDTSPTTTHTLQQIQEYLSTMFSRKDSETRLRIEDDTDCNNGLKSKGYFLCFI